MNAPPAPRRQAATLLTSAFLISACGLFYQLILGTLSSYLLGDSVTQFSITIGLFLAAMGVGAYLSRWVDDLQRVFLWAELALALIGGFSATALLAAFALLAEGYRLVLLMLIAAIGALIGLELPLLVRWARKYASLRDTVARLFALDYLGALLAGLAFPLLLLPRLGVTKTAFVIGAVSAWVAVINLRFLPMALVRRAQIGIVAVYLLLGAGFWFADPLSDLLERGLYSDPIVYAEQTPYQRIVMTTFQDDLRLFLDRELQFSARDEYRYHEALVHPAMAAVGAPRSVLVIGGGDGLAVRELRKYALERIVLVDLDPAMTRIAREFAPLRRLNGDALSDPRLRIVNDDGFHFVSASSEHFDVVLIDLPDPRSESLARLYSREFYGLVARRLSANGVLVLQASSPFMVREAYWTVVETVRAAGLDVQPYRTNIPSFGEWGFVLAGVRLPDWQSLRIEVPTRYLDADVMRSMARFPPDQAAIAMQPSTLSRPRVLERYREAAARWR